MSKIMEYFSSQQDSYASELGHDDYKGTQGGEATSLGLPA